MTSVLRLAAFRRIAVAYTLNSLLEWFGSVALMVLVYDATNSAAVAAAMLLCKQVLPGVLLPFIGQQADRVAPRVAVAATAVVQAAAIAVLAFTGYGLLIFPLAVLAGAASALTRGVLRATVARSLPEQQLRPANAVLNLVMCVAGPVAPLIAAGVISQSGPALALQVAAVGFVALAVCGAALQAGDASISSADAPDADEPSAPTAPRSTAVPLAWLFVLGGAVTCISTIDEPSLLAFTRDSLSGGVGGYGAIFAAQAVGIAIGSALFARLLTWPMLRIYALATVLAGLGFLGMGVAPSIEIACAAALLVGVGTGMDWVAIVTAVQEATLPGQETRNASRIEAAGMIGPGVGIVLGGVIAELGSPRLALVASGLLALGVLLLGVTALRLRTTRLRVVEPTFLSASIPGGSA